MGNKGTVLIVDDVEINRLVLKDIFEDSYNIIEASGGAAYARRQWHRCAQGNE